MPDINDYSVSVEILIPSEKDGTPVDRPPSKVHVQVQAPGEASVAWHWYPQIVDFNRRSARRFFGADGVCFDEELRDDVVDKIAARVRSIKGLRFPADKPKDDAGETPAPDDSAPDDSDQEGEGE